MGLLEVERDDVDLGASGVALEVAEDDNKVGKWDLEEYGAGGSVGGRGAGLRWIEGLGERA